VFDLELEGCVDIVRSIDEEYEIEIEQIMNDYDVSCRDAEEMRLAITLQTAAVEDKEKCPNLYLCVKGK